MGIRKQFRERLHNRLALRLHMFLIVAAAAATGSLLNWYLLHSGVTSPVLRYPAAVFVGYISLFAFVRLWAARTAELSRCSLAVVVGAFPGARDTEETPGAAKVGEGTPDILDGLSDFVTDDEGAIFFVVLAATTLLLFGFSGYLIWTAPNILGDIALECGLVACLAPLGIAAEGWKERLFRATWLQFLVLFVAMIILGWAMMQCSPNAVTLRQAVAQCAK